MIIIPRGYLRGRRFPAFDRRMPLIMEPGPWQPPKEHHYGEFNFYNMATNNGLLAVPVKREWLESIIGEITTYKFPINGFRVQPIICSNTYEKGNRYISDYTYDELWPMFFKNNRFSVDCIGNTAEYDRHHLFLSAVEFNNTVPFMSESNYPNNIIYDPWSRNKPYGIYGIDTEGYLTLSADGTGDRLSWYFDSERRNVQITSIERSPEWLCLFLPPSPNASSRLGFGYPNKGKSVIMNPIAVLKEVQISNRIYGIGTHELVSIEDTTIEWTYSYTLNLHRLEMV